MPWCRSALATKRARFSTHLSRLHFYLEKLPASCDPSLVCTFENAIGCIFFYFSIGSLISFSKGFENGIVSQFTLHLQLLRSVLLVLSSRIRYTIDSIVGIEIDKPSKP
jgi:hypothetical protein